MQKFKNLIHTALQQLDIKITKYSSFEKLLNSLLKETAARKDLELLVTLPHEHASQILDLLIKSKSQLRQDLFVLSHLNFKRNGFFVEFGATNGVDLSNSYLMEKEFGWLGILAEPARCWVEDLKKNRIAHLETKCVWIDSNSKLIFNEVSNAEFSTIDFFSSTDWHQETRQNGKTYEVETISLNDLLDKYNAPRQIDYLSIDTEGSEFEILNNLDFSKYVFRVITCEHNFTPQREKIFNLLVSKGYKRVYEGLSDFDDWYVNTN